MGAAMSGCSPASKEAAPRSDATEQPTGQGTGSPEPTTAPLSGTQGGAASEQGSEPPVGPGEALAATGEGVATGEGAAAGTAGEHPEPSSNPGTGGTEVDAGMPAASAESTEAASTGEVPSKSTTKKKSSQPKSPKQEKCPPGSERPYPPCFYIL